MPSHFTLRMQFNLETDPRDVTEQLLDLVKSAPVDEVMLFFFAEELNDGHDTLDRIQQWVDHSRPFREALKKAGVAVSLNPWHTQLHCDRFRKLKPGQNWQTMVGPDGKAASAVVCPLDPHWRKYYEAELMLYAREGFRVIWIDDDIRFHNHRPLDWGGCFCPLHVEEFNRRAGTKASREEIVKECLAAEAPHPWRKIWLDMWDDTQTAMIAGWRKLLEKHGVKLGLMSSSPEAHAAEGRHWDKWWKAFGGTKPPIHRPHFFSYSETVGHALPNSIALLDQNRSVQPDKVESGPEIENFRYGPWNKSFRVTGAQMALAHVLGSMNLNISLYDFMGNRPDDEPERARFLKEWRPACDWLADTFPMALKPVGVGIPWSEDMGRTMRTDGSGKWQSLTCPSRGWSTLLGSIGVAFSMRPMAKINALAGQLMWSFSDKQLRKFLSAVALVDGVAAEILIQRGFGDYIGAKSGHLHPHSEMLYSVERCTLPEFSLRPGAMISVNLPEFSKMFQGKLLPGAKIASELCDPTLKPLGHGMYVFENKLGGRVAVFPFDANGGVEMVTQRAVQLKKTLEWLDPENHYGNVDGGAWLVPQFLTDGKKWRGVVWNGSADELDTFTFCRPKGMPSPKKAIHVNAHGSREECSIKGNVVKLKYPLHEWEFVVLM